MNRLQLEKFINYLQKENWLVYGPAKNRGTEREEEISPYLKAHQTEIKPESGDIFIAEIQKAEDLVLDGRRPFFPFKKFFVSENEILFEYKNSAFKEKKGAEKIALVGINILDLKAVNLYDQVFEKDPYYQARRRNILIVGYSLLPKEEDNIFAERYEEDMLEHLPFDIFLTAPASPNGMNTVYELFTGSIKGQLILEHFGYKNYRHIQFSGPVKESAPDKKMVLLRDKLTNSHNQKIWDELGARCLECGKCTIVCPTCFCFRLDDQAELGPGPAKRDDQTGNYGSRNRCWDSCFYQEFSEVAGGKKFLRSTAERIHFWYFHKFARIPEEFDFMGCVGCRRCTKVCPVNIDIAEVLKDIKNS